MKFENQNGKLRKLWNKNKNNSSELEALPTPIPKKLSETRVNKYVQNLYTSEWENTILSFDSPLSETWSVIPTLPEIDWTVNATWLNPDDIDDSPTQYQFDLLWYNWQGINASIGADKPIGVVPPLPNTFANGNLQRNVQVGEALGDLTVSLSAQGFLTTDVTPEPGTSTSTLSSAINYQHDILASQEKIYPETRVQTQGVFSSSISGTYESSVRLQVRYEVRFSDGGTQYTIRYVTRNSADSYSPGNTFLITNLTMNRNLADDVKYILINNYGKTESEVDTKLINGTYRIRDLFIRQDQQQTTEATGAGALNVSSATLDWEVNYFKIVTGTGVAVFQYNLLSDEFALPEKLAPYVNIDVLSKLIDKEITSFNVGGYSADFHYLKTKALLIQTADLGDGYYKYRAKATGAFFKEVTGFSDINDYPQVMMFVNFIRPEDYKQVNNHKFR